VNCEKVLVFAAVALAWALASVTLGGVEAPLAVVALVKPGGVEAPPAAAALEPERALASALLPLPDPRKKSTPAHCHQTDFECRPALQCVSGLADGKEAKDSVVREFRPTATQSASCPDRSAE
jgi:hypothetical protein